MWYNLTQIEKESRKSEKKGGEILKLGQESSVKKLV